MANDDEQKRPFVVTGDPEHAATAVDASVEAASVAAAAASSSSSATSAPEEQPNGDLTIARAMQAFETLTSLYGFSPDAVGEAIEKVNSSNAGTNAGVDLVAACCDYILDNGLGVDAGGAIAPIENCPHVVGGDGAVAAGGERSVSNERGNSNSNSNSNSTSSNPGNFGCISVTAADVPEDIFELPCGYFGEGGSHGKKRPTGGFKEDIEYSDAGDGRATCPRGENWWCLQCGGIYCSRYVNGHGVRHYEEHKVHCVMIGLADLSVWCHRCGSYLQTQHHPRLSSILQRLQDIKFRDEKH